MFVYFVNATGHGNKDFLYLYLYLLLLRTRKCVDEPIINPQNARITIGEVTIVPNYRRLNVNL